LGLSSTKFESRQHNNDSVNFQICEVGLEDIKTDAYNAGRQVIMMAKVYPIPRVPIHLRV